MNTFEMAVAAELQNEHGVSEFAYMDRLRYFEAMIRADEREACAKVCDDLDWSQDSTWQVATIDCAEAIRARNKE
jgi:hypothetical protein